MARPAEVNKQSLSVLPSIFVLCATVSFHSLHGLAILSYRLEARYSPVLFILPEPKNSLVGVYLPFE